jgi:hypothetical protein
MGNYMARLDVGKAPVRRASGRCILVLCALMAMIEGADLQAIGVAAPPCRWRSGTAQIRRHAVDVA